MFSQFGGAIESVQLMPSKGYGFVSFYRSSDAVVAMNHLNGFLFSGSKKPIRIELKH
jgi:RNA recognition motif-containing protein